MKYFLALLAVVAAYFVATKTTLVDKFLGEQPGKVPVDPSTLSNPFGIPNVANVQDPEQFNGLFVSIDMETDEPGKTAESLRKFAAYFDNVQKQSDEQYLRFKEEEDARLLAQKERKMTPNTNDLQNPQKTK